MDTARVRGVKQTGIGDGKGVAGATTGHAVAMKKGTAGTTEALAFVVKQGAAGTMEARVAAVK